MSARNNTGKNAAYRTSLASSQPIHGKHRINWLVLGSWTAILLLFLAFWAGVIAIGIELFM